MHAVSVVHALMELCGGLMKGGMSHASAHTEASSTSASLARGGGVPIIHMRMLKLHKQAVTWAVKRPTRVR